ncbi:MAG: MFS transporter [Novosphingobium sp.]
MAQRGSYLGEVRANWQLLLAASLGTGVGLQLFSYITGVFGPYITREFHWSNSLFALVGLAMLSTLFVMPVAGWLTDRFGVRRMALAGVLLSPLPLLAYSLMQGPFWQFIACSVAQLAIGSLTGPITWTRLVAARFDQARGLALTIVMCAPAMLGAIAAPTVTAINEALGWRTGYRMLAAFVLIAGLSAIALIPAGQADAGSLCPREKGAVARTWREIRHARAFWVIAGAMVLIAMPTPLHGSQMALLIRAQHLSATAAGWMVSIFALGTMAGRIGSGLAFDRFAARKVAVISMMLPSFGLLLIASPLDTPLAVGAGLFLIGATVGAEGDLLSFLISRYFRLEIFSTTLSLACCGVFIGSATGALIASRMLKAYNNDYGPFLVVAAIVVLAGSLLFLFLPSAPRDRMGEAS